VVANNQLKPPSAAAPRATSSQFLLVGLFLLAVAAALVIMALSAVSVSDQIRWGAIALAVFCAGLLLLMAVAVRHDGLGLATWRLGPWSLVWGTLAFGLATLSWLGPQSGPSAEILPDSILRALWMIGVALAMLTVGYCAGPHRLAAARARRATDVLCRRFTDEIRGPAVPWILLVVGIVAQYGFAVLTGHFGYVGNVAASVTTAPGYSQYLAVAGECVPLAVLAGAVRAYRTRTLGGWFALGILFAAAIVAGAIAGNKESFAVAILAVVIPWTIVRRRLPVGAIVAAVLLFLLVIIPFNLAYRTSARGGVMILSTGQAVAAAPAIAGQVVASDLSAAVLSQSARYLTQRIRTIDTPAIVMQRTPSEIPYASPGQLLIAPVVDLIPRILWPDKPILTPGYQVSQEYYQIPSQVYTSSNVTPEADLYRHGGWVPLIAGMLLLGYVIRILDEMADLRRGVHGALLVILLFPGIIGAGSDCASLLAGIPGMILLWLAVVSLSFTRRPGTRRPGHGR
jgi:NADH:ubiquinone oxidoreductase subunit 3 (subunit A)